LLYSSEVEAEARVICDFAGYSVIDKYALENQSLPMRNIIFIEEIKISNDSSDKNI